MGNSDRFSSFDGPARTIDISGGFFCICGIFCCWLVGSIMSGLRDGIEMDLCRRSLWPRLTQSPERLSILYVRWNFGVWIKLCAAVFACDIGVNETRLDVIVSIEIGLISLEIAAIVHGLLRVVHGYFNNFLSFFCWYRLARDKVVFSVTDCLNLDAWIGVNHVRHRILIKIEGIARHTRGNGRSEFVRIDENNQVREEQNQVSGEVEA